MPGVGAVDLMPPVQTQIRKPVRAVLAVAVLVDPDPETIRVLPEQQILAAVVAVVDMIPARELVAAQAALVSSSSNIPSQATFKHLLHLEHSFLPLA